MEKATSTGPRIRSRQALNINTPLELAIDNQVDRFSLAIDVIDRVPRLRAIGAHASERFRNIQLKCSVDLEPLALIARLAALVPPRLHVVRYSGVLAPAAKLRPLIVPPPPSPTEGDAAKPANKPPTHRCAYIPWAILAKKTFKEDIDRCPKCGGKMKLKSLVREPDNIARFLRHLGEPTEPPPLAVPSGPRAYPPCPCPTRLRRARRRPERPPSGRFASSAASPCRRPKCSTPSPSSPSSP